MSVNLEIRSQETTGGFNGVRLTLRRIMERVFERAGCAVP
jgi:hypothetical protein